MPKRAYLPILILVLISILLDQYVNQGVRVLTNALTNIRLAHFIYWGWYAITNGVLILFLYLLFRVFPKKRSHPLFNSTLNLFLTLFVTRLVFAVFLLGEDVYRVFLAAIHLLTDSRPLFAPRSIWVSSVAAITSVVPFAAFSYGTTRGKYRYKVHRTVLYFDELPEAFDGFTIAQLSDIHAGSFDNPEAVKLGIDELNANHPDLFVFTGDLVNNRADEIVPYLDIFKRVNAPYGKFSVLGNHDYGDYVAWPTLAEKAANLDQLKQYHRELGYRLLLDEHVQIRKDGQQFTLMGVENWGKGFGERGKLNQALSGVAASDFKILLSHDPSHWDAQVKNNRSKIHLTLSGHTHGMQFGIELGRFKWSPVKYRYKNWAGLHEENHRYLYVNRGFGFLGFSGRIGIWPEIALFELRRGELVGGNKL